MNTVTAVQSHTRYVGTHMLYRTSTPLFSKRYGQTLGEVTVLDSLQHSAKYTQYRTFSRAEPTALLQLPRSKGELNLPVVPNNLLVCYHVVGNAVLAWVSHALALLLTVLHYEREDPHPALFIPQSVNGPICDLPDSEVTANTQRRGRGLQLSAFSSRRS